MPSMKDLTGQKFNRLTAIKPTDKRKGSNIIWLFECDCGNTIEVAGSNVSTGNTKSCGCLKKEIASKLGKSKRGEYGISAFNSLYSSYKYEATQRNHLFELSREQFEKLTKRDCHYCGRPPEQIKNNGIDVYIYNGVDRKNNLRGYVIDNCVPCCKYCNRAKYKESVYDFKLWLKYIRDGNFLENLKIAKLTDNAIIPKRKHRTDAGIDLFADGNYIIKPHSYKVVHTGITLQIPYEMFGLIKPKSKNNYLIGAGVVDSGYQGEILIKIFNILDDNIVIRHGDGVAQIIFLFTPNFNIKEVPLKEIHKTETERGVTGGIHSS